MAITLVARSPGRLAPALAAFLALAGPAVAQQANEAQRNAIRQACPADYQAHCASVPPGGKPAFDCLARNLAKLSPRCQRAVKAVVAGVSRHTPVSSAAHAPPSAVAAAPAAQPMPLREELMLLRQSCGGDFRALCEGVSLGGGRAIACLHAHHNALSPQCAGALSAARGGR
jgi:hypothetical protein